MGVKIGFANQFLPPFSFIPLQVGWVSRDGFEVVYVQLSFSLAYFL